MFGSGFTDRTMGGEEIESIVARAADELHITGKRILVVIPDGTRTMPMPLMFGLLQRHLAQRASACDYLVALGTHPRMSDEQLSSLIGRAVVNEHYEATRIANHRWDLPDTFHEVGTIPAGEVSRLTDSLVREAAVVRINRMIFDYDHVLICGPVFPHEVVGFSGGNKYLFPGISGREFIDFTHWVGALIGSYDVIGSGYTPVRALINRAAELVSVPVGCLALVLQGKDIAGMYFGTAQEAWKAAAKLSSQKHIVWVDRPFRRVLSVMPAMYADIWTAAKGMYKVEPAVADGGEVIIYAPHITEVSYTHGEWIRKVGYHCRDYFLAQWGRFNDVPRGVLAHSTHLMGKGTYDPGTGVETPRINVTLATGISEQQCRELNVGYMDPATIRVEDWQGREQDGIKVIPRAGEVLYRVNAPAVREPAIREGITARS